MTSKSYNTFSDWQGSELHFIDCDVGPRGDVLAEAGTQAETIVRARIPIADFRVDHRQPFVHMDLYRPVFEAYENAYGPNLFDGYLPTDLYDAKRYLGDKSRWTK